MMKFGTSRHLPQSVNRLSNSVIGTFSHRTPAGSEVNTAVAFSQIHTGKSSNIDAPRYISCQWTSILPLTHLGREVAILASERHVDISTVYWVHGHNPDTDDDGHLLPHKMSLISASSGVPAEETVPRVSSGPDLGVFHVDQDEGRILYQRRNGVFSQCLNANTYDWPMMLRGGVKHEFMHIESPVTWVHVTGITPLLGDGPAASWNNLVHSTVAEHIPLSIDINFRPALASFTRLWSLVEAAARVATIVVVSTQTLSLLCPLLFGSSNGPLHCSNLSTLTPEDPKWIEVLEAVRKHLRVPVVVCCFKSHPTDIMDSNWQYRWSVAAVAKDFSSCKEAGMILSTCHVPIRQYPIEQLGGGDSWIAGYIDYMLETCLSFNDSNDIILQSCLFSAEHQLNALNRGDCLSALCQETVGDWSQVNREQLEAFEARRVLSNSCVPFVANPKQCINLSSSDDLQYKIDRTYMALSMAKVVAILRCPSASSTAAIHRGMELVRAGCQAIEVTLDTRDWTRVVRGLIREISLIGLSSSVIVGVGTVMDPDIELPLVASTGASFALSPVNPTGMVTVASNLGILAVPAAATPNEIWTAHCQGARVIKVYPANQYNPTTFKSWPKPLRSLSLCATGGVTPENANEWLQNGCFAVGLASNLIGNDINLSPDTPEWTTANNDWLQNGLSRATTLFQTIFRSQNKDK